MKTLFILIVAAVLALSLSTAGFAQEQKAAVGNQQTTVSEKKMEPKEKAMRFTGEVTAVNTTDKTIVVKGKEGEKTFDVSKATMKGEVKPEHTVHVTYMEKEGKMVASSVSGVQTATKSGGNKEKKEGM
jgi:hypothetical protein